MSGARLTRRDFVAGAVAAGSFAGVAPALPLASTAAPAIPVATPVAEVAPTGIRKGSPVVSFHLDRPYLDLTGEALAYVPPPGARGARAFTGLSEEALFCLSLR